DPRHQPEIRDVRHLVRRDERGAHRAEAVDIFPDEPLTMLLLQRARGDVIDDRVAKDVREGVLLAYAAPGLPDHDGQLDLVVHRIGGMERSRNIDARADDGRRRLRKDDRHVGDFGVAGGRIEAAPMELAGVLEIVLADAEDVSPRPGNWREKLYPVDRNG